MPYWSGVSLSNAWRRCSLVISYGSGVPAALSTRLTSAMTSSGSSPPSLISTPRPAMLVAMVTAPNAPARAMIWILRRACGHSRPGAEMPPCRALTRRGLSCGESSRIRSSRSRFSGSSGFMLRLSSSVRARLRNTLTSRLAYGRVERLQLGDTAFWHLDVAFFQVNVAYQGGLQQAAQGSAANRSERRSECSTEVVPTNCGRPRIW